MRQPRVCFSLSLMTFACLISCAPRGPSTLETGTRQRQPVLHALHDARLRQVMRELQEPAARLPQELDGAARMEARREQVAEVAAALKIAARRIPDSLQGVLLEESHRKRFNTLADRLFEQALELEESARDQSIDQISSKVGNLTETCNSCHTSFRILPAIRGAGSP